MKKALKNIRQSFGKWLLRKQIGNLPFTIFSNDCYGGEIYRWLNREYNTPFVGLMLMAPCYIKLLQAPKKYLGAPIVFVKDTKYVDFRPFRTRNHNYPIGMLDDIEIHFLHYASEEEALQKWMRRVQKIDWEHIKVKFAMDKDYATESLLQDFEQLDFPCKLSVSKESYSHSKHNVQVPGFVSDAATTFRYSLKVVDLKAWMNGQVHCRLSWPRIGGLLAYYSLKR